MMSVSLIGLLFLFPAVPTPLHPLLFLAVVA